MENRNNDSPNYLRSENDDLAEDASQSLPVDEPGGDKHDLKDNNPTNKDTKSSEWQHRLREEMGAGKEEKDFTD